MRIRIRHMLLMAFFAVAHPIVLALLTNYGFTFSNAWFCCPSLFWFFLGGTFFWIKLIQINGADEIF